MKAGSLIAWSGVESSFDGRVIFHGFSGELSRGERLRVKGGSGSGKTTFLQMVLGLERPVRGVIEIVADIRELAAYVPQEPDFGSEGMVQEWIEVVFSFKRNRVAKPSLAAIEAMLTKLGLSRDILQESVASISGGEKQRIAIAVALMLPREVLILDEPFSALDGDLARKVAAVIKDSGRAVIYASHVDPVNDFATREVLL